MKTGVYNDQNVVSKRNTMSMLASIEKHMWQTAEEDGDTQRPKRCKYNKQDEHGGMNRKALNKYTPEEYRCVQRPKSSE